MLPPVRAISGSSGSYQNSSSVVAGAHLSGEPIFPGQAADADRDVNPNLAGKLNVLLLSGRDILSEDLSMLADALGKAIGMPRHSGEVSAAYVERLAEVLANLAAGPRAEAERQLNLILRGVRLQLVIAAFLNPAGPEAARVVALIETAGLKANDLATRTVLTSYRQNGGADIPLEPPMQGPPRRDGMLPFTLSPPLPRTLSAPPNDAMPAGQPLAPLPADGVDEMPLIFPEELEDEPELVIFHPETDNIFSRTSAEPLPDPVRPTALASGSASGGFAVSGREVTEHAARNTGRMTAPIADARTLQTVLAAAFEAGENADPVIQAKAAIELLASEERRPEPLTLALRPDARREEPAVKPFIDYTRPPPRPAAQTVIHTSILALKGWTEGDVLGMSLLPASLEAEAVLTAALTPHAGPEPDVQDSLYNLRGRGNPANDDRHRIALSAAEQQLLRNADEAAGLSADRRLDMPAPATAAAQRGASDALIASALLQGHDSRIGIPYATVPYPLADERDEGPGDRAGYRSQSGKEESEGGDDEQRDEEQQASEGPAREVDEKQELVFVATGEDVGRDLSDPAYDYYQRMGGFS